MADTEPIDVDADTVVEPEAEPDVTSDQQQKGKRKLSPMYDTWGFYQAGDRTASHKGAQCIACANYAKQKGIPLNLGGVCNAEIQAILAHVKNNCPHQTPSAKAAAAAELQTLRTKRKPADKRPFTAMSQTDTAGSSGSGNSGLAKFMALKDQPLTPQEQKKFEQHCLKGTVSANLPFSCWDDNEFRQTFLSLRPAVQLPSRKTMSTRILNEGAAVAWEQLSKILRDSDGRPAAVACESCMQVLSQLYSVSINSNGNAGCCIATDSWTNIRRKQIMAFMAISSARQVGQSVCYVNFIVTLHL